jgi:hypothetical protein
LFPDAAYVRKIFHDKGSSVFGRSGTVGTILFAEDCQPYGGDTMWAGMCPAFEGLSDGLQRTLLGMRAVHANVRKLGPSYERTSPSEGGAPDLPDWRSL